MTTSTNAVARATLRELIPAEQWRDAAGREWHRHAQDDRTPSRQDVIRAAATLDAELVRRGAAPRPGVLCPVREALFAQTFDELVRQVGGLLDGWRTQEESVVTYSQC